MTARATLSCLLAGAVLGCGQAEPADPKVAGSAAASSGGMVAAVTRGGSPGAGKSGAASGGAGGAVTAGGADAGPMREPPREGDVDAGPEGLSLEQAIQEHRSWQRRTAEPQPIAAEIASLCRLPTLAEQRFVDSKHGQNQWLLLDFLNAPAARGVAAKASPAFERDSAIAKQKLAPNASGKLELQALGLMIKRAPGFDAAHGDWEYGYWEPASGLSSGRDVQTYCGDCHAQSRTDHVFLDAQWRL